MPHHGMVWYGKSNSLPIPMVFYTPTIPYQNVLVWYGKCQDPIWYHVLLPITPKSIRVPKLTKVQILFYVLLIDFIYIYIYLYTNICKVV